MSSDALSIDAYFDSEPAAQRIAEAFGARSDWGSSACLEALAELGFAEVEALQEWFDVSCCRRDRKIHLAFEASSSSAEHWQGPLIAFLTDRGATHVLVDLVIGSVGERVEYGYVAGQRTTVGRLMKALRAIDPDVALAEAVERKRIGDVKKLLATGADPNGARIPHLVAAVRAESPRVLDLLLAAGADVNEQTAASGEAALHCCARLGEHEIRDQLAELLLRHGADPNLRNAEGWSPLLLAADFGSARLSQRLLENGGDPNTRLEDGRTVAMVAASSSNDGLGVLRTLGVHGADLAAVDRDGRSVFFHALPRIELEDHLLAQGLERYVPEQEYSGNPVRDLFTAIRYRHLERARVLVRDRELANAELDVEVEHTSITALYLATDTGRDEIVELLLDHGADPNVASGYGTPSTPLWNAAKKGNGRIVSALLVAGADPDSGWSHLETPLMAAVKINDLEIVQSLLEAGADPKAECRGRSVLASASGRTQEARAIFELLVTVAPLEGKTGHQLLEKAVNGDDRWLLERLVRDGVTVRGSDLAMVVVSNDWQRFEHLSSLFDGDPSTLPLVTCCQQLIQAKGQRRRQGQGQGQGQGQDDQHQIFERLLDMGADVEQTSSSQETPLTILQRKKGFVRETRALLALGATTNRRVPLLLGGKLNGFFSALHIASYYGLIENATVLIDAGAEVDLEEGDGRHGTALLIAKARGKKKMIALLLERGAQDVEPAVPVGSLSLAEAKRRFVEVSRTSPYVRLEKRSATRAVPVEGLAPELAELFSRYQRVIVFDGPPEENGDEPGLDAALLGSIEELDGYLRIGSGGTDFHLLNKPGEETVYPYLVGTPDPPRPYPSFYHWALVQIEWAEQTADI